MSQAAVVGEIRNILTGKGRPDFLRGISVERVSIAGLQLKPRETTFVDLLEFLNSLGRKAGKKVIIAFDEAQYLRFYGPRGGKELLAAIAYAYDSIENLGFVFTGSEVGFLHDFLGLNDYSSLLYRTFDMTMRKARSLVREELLELGKRSGRYSLILHAMAMRLTSWSTIKEYVEAKAGPVTNARLSELLRTLKRGGG